jgi:hypothetical protein
MTFQAKLANSRRLIGWALFFGESLSLTHGKVIAWDFLDKPFPKLKIKKIKCMLSRSV